MDHQPNLYRNQYFEMTTDPSDCINKIMPLIRSVNTKIQPIGAIADDSACSTEKVTGFFDPKVRGDCVIHDELVHSMYSFRHHTEQSQDWRAKQTWHDTGEYWEWQLEIEHRAGDARQMRVELSLPHPIFPGAMGSGHSGWQLWLPISQESQEQDYGVKKVHFSQCIDEKTDVPLPLCTLMNANPDANMGLSYFLPPDQMWYTDFEIDQRNWLTKITFKYLGLSQQGKIHLRLWCFSHEGDWRPALGWVRNKFPELLGPVPGQDKLEGNMAYTIPMIPDKRISDWSNKMYLRWNELFYCRSMGDYCPEEPFNADHFKTLEHPEWSADGLNYDDINRYIDMCHKHHVKVMPYFNLAECESTIARKYFSDSIVKVFGDNEMVTWTYYDKKNYNILMNGDPSYSFLDAVISQFDKLLHKCPEIDGFFFDQVSYGWIDTAHSDGMTFYNNKPAYNLGNMYLRALKKVREVFPRPRINGMGNGVVRWQIMEYIDGVMAEGDPKALGRLSVISPERPSVCLAEGENAFQNALYYGSWLHVSPYYRYPTTESLPTDAIDLFTSYTPLLEFLEGRKIVYTPSPLRVQTNSENLYKAPLFNPREDVKANIFKTSWGGYAVVVLAPPKGMSLNHTRSLPLTIKVNVPNYNRFKQVVVFGVDYEGYTVEQSITDHDKNIIINVPRHGAASMVLLCEEFDRLKSDREWLKLTEPNLSALGVDVS